MKCSKCDYVALEKTAKFCSQCGTALSTLSEKMQNESPVIPQAADAEVKTEMNPDSSTLDNRSTAASPKRPNDNSPNVKKKKKKKKKKRKASEKDGGSLSLSSVLSDISLTDNVIERTQEGAMSSESEESVCPMDETPDSSINTSAQAQNIVSPGPLVNTSDDACGNSIEDERPTLSEADANKNLASGEQVESGCVELGERQDQKSQCGEDPIHQDGDGAVPASSETPEHEQMSDKKKPKPNVQKDASKKSQSQKDDSKKTQSQKDDSKKSQNQKDDSKKSQNQKDDSKKSQNQKDDSKKSQNQKDDSKKSQSQIDTKKTQHEKVSSDVSSKTESVLDQNANVDSSGNANAGPCTQKTESLNEEEKKKMVFGPQSRAQVKSSSVDPPLKEHNQPLQSARGKGDTLSGRSSPESKKTNDSKEADTRKDLPPERIPTSTQQISKSERLTIYFHAVLSKDFKFNPDEDRIFIRAGKISDWKTNLVELSVTRDLNEHGFLVEGSWVSTKTIAEAVSIPYKYVVYRNKKEKYDFEFIYKVDSAGHTNRCLFVKGHLLNTEGDWHQYDDIICAEPSTGLLKKLKDTIWPEQRKNVINGREIAGSIMLETIFDFLRSWNEINLRNFITQLRQFHQLYGNPFVFEEKEKRWTSLNYTEKDVSNLIQHFMIEHVTPELHKDGSSKKSEYIKEPLKAALIMLYLWKQYELKLGYGELNRLCSALCLPNLPKDEFVPYWKNIQESFSCLKTLPDTLVELINTVRGEGLTRWIVAIPLLHLLKGASKPFEPVSFTANQNSDQAWAGLQGLKLTYTKLFNSQHRRSMLNLMKASPHLLEVDTLMARSFMFQMTVDELVECSTYIHVELFDMLHLFVLKAPTDISYSSSPNVSDTLTFIQTQLLEQKYRCFSDDYGRNCLAEAVKLLEKICKGVKSLYRSQSHIPVACINLVASVSDFCQCLPEQNIQEKDHPKAIEKGSKIIELLSVALKTMRTWIGQAFKSNLLQNYTLNASFTSEIEMWNNIISISFKSEEFTKEWRDTFTRDLEGKFQQESSIDQIEAYCSRIEELNDTHPHVARSIEKCALQAVTTMCQTKTEARLFERCKINWKFGKLISAIIQKSWPKTESGSYQEREEVVLQHLLNWTAAKNIFQLHGADEKLIDQLSEEAKERLAMATSLFTNISDQLIRGSIRIKVLNHILAKKDTFTELVKIDCLCENEKCKDASAVKRLLQLRENEVKDIYHDSELVKGIIAMCQNIQEHVSVDFGGLEEKHQIDIDEMPLDKFMEVHPFSQIASPMAGVVTYFELDDNVRCMAEILHKFKESYIFKVCWENQAKFFARRPADEWESDEEDDLWAKLDVIYKDIFQPCYSEYQNIYKSLKDGSMTFEKIDQIFKAYVGKYAELEEDATIMSKLDPEDDKRWILRRIQQIEQYHELHLAVESAQVVMMVKQILGLQGDFQVLEKLLIVTNLDFKKEPLDSIDNELMQAKTVLVDITEPRRLCLQELDLRKHFVIWVREALEDINELKVFVDLASISAGENDMDVDRVACFHDAVLGYSSVLYELKSDAGFRAFKEALKKLWKALDNDPNLPNKLRDTSRHLEWLKTVKDSHGSVELSSLSLASAINAKGVYMISAEKQKKLSLDKVLRLRIPEEHDEGHEMRCYSLEDLKDLQNKLMLMSGKGEQGQNEVDRFAEVFASVQRLGSAFIDLFVAGNPLFRLFDAIIHCNSEEACIVMDFNLTNVASVVMVKGDVAEQLLEVCKKMERCLSFWKSFMDQQRSQYYYLNYFTAEQIVYLCSQLTQKNLANLDDQALMMLSFIKPNCTTSNLRKSWHALQYSILTKPLEQNEDINFQTFVDISNQPETEMDIGNVSDFGPENDARGIDKIWNTYMRNMKHFLPDSLDVRSLGRLLEILSDSSIKTKMDVVVDDDDDESVHQRNVQRELPRGLVIGKPNLIICPLRDIQASCISIYMNSEDEPLPTYDEVLLCDCSTSYEQVELFLRRCLTAGYKGQKIYTMLYADQLTYEVSYKVEQFFQRHKAQSRNDYRLVLICSSEREHAYIPSVFSQFRLHMVPQEPLSRIQEYLAKHYTVAKGYSSAAAVFKNRKFVGVVSSRRAGVGKSLYIQRLYERLQLITKKPSQLKCIRLIEPRVDENAVLQSMLNSSKIKLTIFHFDVTSSVQKGLNEFLFRLLILGYLLDSEGRMWKCSNRHLYIIELLQSSAHVPRNCPRSGVNVQSAFQDVFPVVCCRTPKEVLELEMRMSEDPSTTVGDDPLMDDKEFRSEAYQRPYQYLKQFHQGNNLDGCMYRGIEGTHVECLQLLFLYCGVMDPSWAELRNFTWFLNLQLKDCELSVFCDPVFTGDTLVGFKNFVVDFMILMAKDFATPSLSISDQSPGRQQMDMSGVNEEDLAPFRIRKRWESEPHPYIFFNDDHQSMTFIGFHLQPNDQNGVDAIDPSTHRVIKKNIMTKDLYEGLKLQRVPFNINFDSLPRGEKIERICNVLGIKWPFDPDDTYELTTDNILKILAIHMRFRCGIPVIIVGETGCGKTRLIKFLCELRRTGVATENMKLVKVHGGTSSDMIYNKVREAEAIACTNKEYYDFDSVLFFDEANTTEAISSIKEILCDKTVKGDLMMPNTGLQIIAACNPYRKHTDVMIKRLESAGLGYRVRAEETDEKLGSIPLRQLVYRVQALPPSMIPLVWDFGQLNDCAERMYIQQIVQRVVETHSFPEEYVMIITDVLSASQKYMRTRNDECSFVSLRDVERCMQVFAWFYQNSNMWLSELAKYEGNQRAQKNEPSARETDERDPILWSLVMAVGVCYQACLEDKEKYRNKIYQYLPSTYSPVKLMQEISVMQDLLLSGVPLGETIARNNALKENVFMMVICIELRIPLFLVGKPGSSKSLSKTLVADAMQGQAAHSDLFRKLKQIHLVSFQCSPHSTPEGIINTFKQCARFQEGKNLKEYISVVVLDEIGLAEDSPKMPLKTLHPLLEEGCIDDQPLPHKKVGFIGISNWALDPAKMNRGIFVSRGDPDEKELIESAKGICSSDAMILEKVRNFFQPFARAYLKICKKEGKGFFGLRDYYSLIKMMFAVAKASDQQPKSNQIVEAVLRNFSGKDTVNAVSVFTNSLFSKPSLESIDTIELVRQNITAVAQDEECRYLLILTKNYAALQILQQTFFSEQYQPEIIFGSSFPKDQQYTQICRNINRVKICMETGQTVVLLNLQNLYESLYDALNQYYVCLGGQKYVDLGLGTHRVKCRVHKDFRLIVIEEKEIVYKQFPIPLINRLEKHYLDINTVLKNEQKQLVNNLKEWVGSFIACNSPHSPPAARYCPADAFIGYHSDTCASVILQVMERQKEQMELSDPQRQLLEEAKLILLNCATPDSVVRLDNSALSRVESEHLARVYFEEQKHSCMADFVFAHIQQEEGGHAWFTEVTTFSRLLTAADIDQLLEVFPNIELLALQQFDTEHSFLKKIRNFLDNTSGNKILIIQTDFDEALQSSNLIASAKYSSIGEINKFRKEQDSKVFVYFITKLPRVEGGTSYVGFHGGPWKSVHIDDLRKSKDIISDIKALQCLTISQLFEEKEDHSEAMETEDIYKEEETEKMEQENNISWENVLDTTALVRSCVQSAVGMLRDQGEAGSRSTRRVEILLTLLSDSEELQATFLKTMKRRLHFLLRTHDEHNFSAKNWVFKEASNIDSIQEGGTFRNTLWKRVQAAVIPFLAQLVSVIDRDHNLDILLDTNSGDSVKKLWLDIFGNGKFLNVPYTRVDANSVTKTILVQNSIVVHSKTGCSMPFSWMIKDRLEELWVHTLHREGHTLKQFEDFFWKTPLGRYIGEAEQSMQLEFFSRYLQDFISLTTNVTTEDELQLLAGALTCCVNELRSHQEAVQNDVISLPWIHAAYHKFKNRLQNFSRMIAIEPQIAQVLLGSTQCREGSEMVLDVYAAMACVEYLEPRSMDDCTNFGAWLRQVKKLQVPIELVCSEESIQHYGEKSKSMIADVEHRWRRIHALSLFVEHVLIGVEDVDKKLKPLVLEHTRQLAQILDKNPDLKMKRPFEAVVTILKACKDGANDRIFRFGFQPCPVCMGDPQDPLNLPCDHIYCLACIKQWLIPGQMYCPLCMHAVDDNFEVKPSKTIQALMKKNGQFRKQCNAFFIDLVSTICFRDNSPPKKDIILHLLSFVMVEAGTVPIVRGGDLRFLTKDLSPFDDSVDKNPVVRSVVLKLLLKYSFADVKGYLQEHLRRVEQSNILENTDKTGLYCLYINCLEDSMFERTQWRSVAEQQVCLLEEKNFLMEFLQKTGAVAAEIVTVEHLQEVARTRLCLDVAADLLVSKNSTADAQKESSPAVAAFLDSVQDLCKDSRNDWYRVYLIRKICSLHGVEYIQKLLHDDQLSWLFPQEVLQMSNDSGQIDQYLVWGVEYKAVRDAVGKAMLDGKVDKIDEACETCRCSPEEKNVYILLALFREVTTLYRGNNPNIHPKTEQLKVLEDFIKNSKVFLTPESRVFAQSLVQNNLPVLRLHPNLSGDEYVVLELTAHLAAVLLCVNQAVLQPLLQLAFFPVNMQRAFIPTMPDDMLAVAQQAMGQLQWYFCPNNHPCTVGECGQPMEKSRCLDCHAEIGGIDHRPVAGFQILGVQGDRTQTGHILGDPQRRDQPDMQDTKNMSPAPFTLLRMLTHMAMLLGASKQPQALTAIIKPPVAQAGSFLMAHLLKDIEQLIRALGKGADDTVCAVHLTICRLLELHQPSQWPVRYDNLLSTKEARNDWEMTVSNDIITQQLKVLETQLPKVNNLIRDDERVSSNPVMKLTFGEPQLFLRNLPQGSLIHGSSVWSCRQRVSLLSLGHILEQNGGKDTHPVLWKFLQKEAELKLVKFLPDILALQRDLVKKFQNLMEIQIGTIAQFLQNLKAVSLMSSYEKRINIFLSTWNQLRGSLATNGEIKLPAEYCQKDLDHSADLQVLLPRRQGLGLCSTALVSYLIALHNDLIYAVDKHTGETTSYTVSPVDLTELHVIRYEVERDLLPLVLSNCQYSMERGHETLSEYDLPKIQQQLFTRFLQGKPFISLNGIPTLVNRHDRNYEIIFQDVKGKVQQESLSSLSQSTLSVELQSYSDVCEALSTVEVALGFLAMTGGEPNMQLGDYLKEVLQMADHTALQVLKALSRCCLKHCMALWQLLTSLKSETMLRLKRDPFVGISMEYKKPLGEEEKRLLTVFFTKTSADSFLLEMHEFLLLVLKNPNATDTYRPNWSMKDTLVSYMERKDMDVPQDLEELFPDEILLAHYIESWKFSVLLRQERMQR